MIKKDDPKQRADLWRILLGYTPTNPETRDSTLIRKRQEYIDACEIYVKMLENPTKTMNEVELKIYKQISVDVPRTMPDYKMFSIPKIREMMLRLLFIWSMRHPASSYVQGFNDLCSPFLAIFLLPYIKSDLETLDIGEEELSIGVGEEVLLEIEADSYWCFSKMLDKVQSNYTHNQPGLQKMVSKMQEIVNEIDEELIKHFELQEVTFIQFAFRWMNCYLMREFNLKTIARIWDTYFSEEDAFNKFHLFVCVSLLLNFSDKLKNLDFQDIIMFLQKLPNITWTLPEVDVLIAKAYQIQSLYGGLL